MRCFLIVPRVPISFHFVNRLKAQSEVSLQFPYPKEVLFLPEIVVSEDRKIVPEWISNDILKAIYFILPESFFLFFSQSVQCFWDKFVPHVIPSAHMVVKYELKDIQVKQLCAEAILHDHVKNVYVAAPLFVISLIWFVH